MLIHMPLITGSGERFTQRPSDVTRCNQPERSLVQVPNATINNSMFVRVAQVSEYALTRFIPLLNGVGFRAGNS